MKTLYLHLGTPKTATTSLQYFCYDNEKLLEKNGICYPDIPYEYGKRNFKKNAHFINRFFYTESEERKRDAEKENKVFENGMEIVSSLFDEYDNILLSDEALWVNLTKYKKNELAKIAEFCEKRGITLKAIVYLRRQDIYIDSYWNQFIKTHTHTGNPKNVLDFDDFYKAHKSFMHPDYYETLEKLSKTFGKENIIVRRFDEAVKKDGGIYADFLSVLGTELTDEYVFNEELKNANTRLSGNTLEIKRVINSVTTLSDKENLFLKNVLFDFSEKSGEIYPSATLNEEETAALMSEYEASNQKLADEYIGDGKPLFSLDYTKSKPKWDKNNEHFVDDIIKFSAAGDIYLYRIAAEQKKEIAELSKLVNKQTRRIDSLSRNIKHPIRAVIKIIIRKIKGTGKNTDGQSAQQPNA